MKYLMASSLPLLAMFLISCGPIDEMSMNNNGLDANVSMDLDNQQAQDLQGLDQLNLGEQASDSYYWWWGGYSPYISGIYLPYYRSFWEHAGLYHSWYYKRFLPLRFW